MKKVGWGENDAGPLDSEVVEQIEDATNHVHVSEMFTIVYMRRSAREELSLEPQYMNH